MEATEFEKNISVRKLIKNYPNKKCGNSAIIRNLITLTKTENWTDSTLQLCWREKEGREIVSIAILLFQHCYSGRKE